jgi:hypothetical protein
MHSPTKEKRNSGDIAAAMERWTGDLHVPLTRGGPLFRVAASLLLTPSKTLAVRMNVSPVSVSSRRNLKRP